MTNFHEKILKSPAYIYANDVAEIRKPLFQNFCINYFSYERIYKDNSALYLMSENKWLDYYTANKYSFLITLKEGVCMWTSMMNPLAIQDGGAHFGFHNGIVIEKRHTDFMEIIEFAAPNSRKHPIEFYVNDNGSYTQFLNYFKEKAALLIEKADQNRFILPDEFLLNKMENRKQKKIENYKVLFPTQKKLLIIGSKTVLCSQREYDCLYHLAHGKAFKEIGLIMQISPRTVEAYITNLKHRAQCYSKKSLVEMFWANQSSIK